MDIPVWLLAVLVAAATTLIVLALTGNLA